MPKIGRVTREGVVDTIPYDDKKILIVQCSFGESQGTADVLYPQSLEDAPPQEGWILYCERFAGGLIALNAWDGKESEAKAGERSIYSLDGAGAKNAQIKLKSKIAIANKTTDLLTLLNGILDDIGTALQDISTVSTTGSGADVINPSFAPLIQADKAVILADKDKIAQLLEAP
ncbi:hypothetical protein FACS1894110_09950 [Spirochaetia bacterium]|nr:hypothetical protein FACS1894110_09950 [Spirochaetia bacterium]